MARLSYVGNVPAATNDVANRGQGTAILSDTLVNRTAVATSVEAEAALRAGKTYIDTADVEYATVAYYQEQDALNIPQSLVGVSGGVAGLVGGKVPLSQLPVLGVGYVKGPYGPTSVYNVSSVSTTPAKLADFAIGIQNLAYQPLCWASAIMTTRPTGRPVLEMRMSSGTAGYSSQTLVAQGFGQSLYEGVQTVTATPATSVAGVVAPSPYAQATNIVISLWVYCTAPGAPLTSVSTLSGAVHLMRMRL